MTFPLCITALQVLSSEECQKIIDCCTPYVEDALVQQGKPGAETGEKNIETRKSKVVLIAADDQRFQSIQEELSKVVNAMIDISRFQFSIPIVGIEAIQFASYEEGDFYDYHLDSSTMFPRNMSASLMLSHPSEYKGGLLNFRDLLQEDEKTLEQDLQQGELGVFPSLLIHKVTPIKEGRRCALVLWGFIQEVHNAMTKQQSNTDSDGYESHNEPNDTQPNNNDPMIF